MSALDPRFPAIDYIKALAIVAVVATHAGPIPWLPEVTDLDRLIRGSLPIFHVPAFLLIAGFLYATQPVLSTADLGRRLRRILVPYVVASLVVMGLGFARPTGPSDAAYMLATGSALGTYYFVFVLSVSVVLVWALTRFSARLPSYALAATITWWLVRPLVVEATPRGLLPSFWYFRNPLWFGSYFLVGWNLRREWQKLQHVLEAHRTALMLLGATACVVHVIAWPYARTTYIDPLARMAYVLSVVGLVTAMTSGARVPATVRFLSESSYTIYLYHSLFITIAAPSCASLGAPLRTTLLTGIGLLGGVMVAYLARVVLGNRSRLVFGT